MGSYVVAHDLGTTGNKATLYDGEGRLAGSFFSGYPTDYSRPGWAEQSPEDWWRAVRDSTRGLIAQSGVARSEVACVVFSGQMMGCVALDAEARPLRPAIIWADHRASEQERWLSERVSPEVVYAITGHRLSASYSLSKMLWLRDHEPDVFGSAHRLVQAKDAMVARLTGGFVTDPSDASGTNLLDLERGEWSRMLIEAADLDATKLPDIVPSTTVVGGLRTAVADEVGLPAGTPVVIGGGDGMCGAVGAGVVREGSAYCYVGSSAWIGLATARPVLDPSRRTFTWAHLVPGLFGPNGTMQAGGLSYQWTRDQLCMPEVEAAERLGGTAYERMDALAGESAVGAGGLLYLPYLLGERSPRWNPRASGAFVGLTIRHTRADLLRAVLEGITLNLHVIHGALTAQGARVEAMRVIGGGAKALIWNRIMADVYGVPVHRLEILQEATSMGAALAGGIGVGLYPDFSMAERMNRVVAVIDPDPAAHARYEEILPVFEAAYEALVPIYNKLAAEG